MKDSSISNYILRAIELAEKGRGFVNPNPLVGAIIVKDGKIHNTDIDNTIQKNKEEFENCD